LEACRTPFRGSASGLMTEARQDCPCRVCRTHGSDVGHFSLATFPVKEEGCFHSPEGLSLYAEERWNGISAACWWRSDCHGKLCAASGETESTDAGHAASDCTADR